MYKVKVCRLSTDVKVGTSWRHMHAHGKEVVIVLLNWLNSKLDLKRLLGDDYISFYTLVVCNQELHALSHSNKNYHQIFLMGSDQYETLFFFCED
jgi:hypothetical protein